jgi:hypothetical protein
MKIIANAHLLKMINLLTISVLYVLRQANWARSTRHPKPQKNLPNLMVVYFRRWGTRGACFQNCWNEWVSAIDAG